MPRIRCKQNDRYYTLSSQGAECELPAIGNSVLVERALDAVFLPFGGFIEIQSELDLESFTTVKLLNIVAFSLSEEVDPIGNNEGECDWVELAKDVPIVGVKKGHRYLIPILDGSVVCYLSGHQRVVGKQKVADIKQAISGTWGT